MRLQRITTNYPSFLRDFYARRARLDREPYSVQHRALMENSSGWADFWAVALSRLGVETDEVISNVEPMQKAWAREHGVAYTEDGWLFEITTAQVKAFRPDVLFVNDYVTFTAAYLKELRRACPFIRLVLGWCGAPYKDPSVFHEYDIVLSSAPELVEDFRAQGHRSYHLNHAFEPRVLERIDLTAEPDTDFAFIGSILKRNRFHEERERLLLALVEKTNLQIWAEVNQLSWRERCGLRARQLAYDAVQLAQRAGVSERLLRAAPPTAKVLRWEARPSVVEEVDPRLVRRAHPSLFGLEMFQRLRLSRVSLNTHIDLSSRYASNMRLYEATGVGSCLLTDWKANLPELFEPDAEVVAYRSPEECIEKVRYLLEHEEERRSIAASGQRRTLREHTFDHRAVQLYDLIHQALGHQS